MMEEQERIGAHTSRSRVGHGEESRGIVLVHEVLICKKVSI